MMFTAGRRPSPLNVIAYEDFRAIASDGMICLTHADDSLNAIQCVTASDYNHGFMIGWLYGVHSQPRLMLAEANVPHSQACSLRWRVHEKSGLLDVFRLRPTNNLDHEQLGLAWGFMLDFTGQDYPLSHINRDLLAIVSGRVKNPIPNSDNPEEERHCTEAIHAALRVSGMPPVVQYDYLMTPGTSRHSEQYKGFADPDIVEYIGTLVWK